MARTDANPPMPDFATDYELQEVDPSYLTASVKPKQFLHIDQAECILCEGCVDICPWKCIHMVSVSAISDAVNTEQPGEDPRDHVAFIVDEDICTRCALCVDRCPTGVIILGKLSARHRRGRSPRPHAPQRLRLRRAVLSHRFSRRQVRGQRQRQQREQRARRHRGEGRPGAGEDRREGPRLAGVDRHLPSRFGVPPRATPTAPATAPT